MPTISSSHWPENIDRLWEFLCGTSQIGTQSIRDFRQRFVNLRTQEMFDSLVNLYADLFMSQWQHYRKLIKAFPPPPDVSPHIYVARCYISMWFINLYASNREAVYKLYYITSYEPYRQKLSGVPHEYDSYLTLLNASIRPTDVKNALGNIQFIPIIADFINVNDPNPFGINNFTPEICLFYGITRIMKEGNHWRFTPLSRVSGGRPWWLFDWHTEDRVCSWFPEDNYTHEDLTLAFILGTACTPNLGVGDVDDWQHFVEDIVPENPNPMNYDRVVDRRFYGSYEVRTMEIQTEEAQERQMSRFKLIDWVYDHRVVLEMDSHKRTTAHRRISLV